jgi:hypothetical protein
MPASRRLTLALLAAAALLTSGLPAAAAQPRPRHLRYLGLRLTVPAGWAVVRLNATSNACVRFDRHAVYLGRPGPTPRCPALAAGHADAILIQPLSARALDDRSLVPAAQLSAVLPSHHALISAAYGVSPATDLRVLGLRRLPAAVRMMGPRSAPPVTAMARRAAHAASATYTGLGFDACSAPSAGEMARWRRSPFGAVGVYIGGVNAACAQPNLSGAWVGREVGAGWHLILTYVGLQAPHNSCGCAAILPSRAAAEGRAAALDAVARADGLGIGRGAAIFFDMEAYPPTATNRRAVLAFLGAWTEQLHVLGFRSGVYGSTGSTVADLVARLGSTFPEPDELWFAAWNGEANVRTAALPAGAWAKHQLIHQFRGDHSPSYGGVRLDIDSDYLDAGAALPVEAPTPTPTPTTSPTPSPVPAVPAPAPITDGTLVQVAGSEAVYRVAGGAPLYVSAWDDIGGPQPVQVITAAQFAALAPVPADGTVLTTQSGATYTVEGGYPFAGAAEPAGARAVLIDGWDVENLGATMVRLSPAPADGTLVQGTPSGQAWRFQNGSPTPAPAAAGALQVPDGDLSAFRVSPGAPGTPNS